VFAAFVGGCRRDELLPIIFFFVSSYVENRRKMFVRESFAFKGNQKKKSCSTVTSPERQILINIEQLLLTSIHISAAAPACNYKFVKSYVECFKLVYTCCIMKAGYNPQFSWDVPTERC
jgi:hypothetical protein